MTPTTRPAPRITPSEDHPLYERVHDLMAQARADDQLDRRGAARYPFFRPVRLSADSGDVGPHQAFTRELSITGVGLLHNIPLQLGKVLVAIHHSEGACTAIPTEILWCRPCGDGWYLSGGRFLFD